ncbi:MAG: hypothetical protein J0I49_05885 [Pseudonocardia sp.]|uniref:hypothetical protein n=1 Tax=Pseudonocardia sp. TaxID=60912 RepID=UPI001AC62B7C|nr:hypothetical protein [Pseudonocardia sp.]MBN9097628.1 hypothetical protein [Pseudonocardia sp.]
MATLWAFMTAPDAQACYGWLTALARGLGRHDPRSMDARRADLMRDLLTGHLTIIPTGNDTTTLPGATAPDPVAPDPAAPDPAAPDRAASTDVADEWPEIS